MEILSSFSETLSELIQDNRLTPETFSRMMRIDRSVIYKYLRGECMPSLPNFILIADYFQCSADFLLGLFPENPKAAYHPTPPFSQRFRTILAENNKTRYRLKAETSFPKNSVDDWYNGKRTPNLDNVLKLAKYFDCSVDFLLGRET